MDLQVDIKVSEENTAFFFRASEYLPTSPHGVIIQKSNVKTCEVMRTLNLKHSVCCQFLSYMKSNVDSVPKQANRPLFSKVL
jgi:hypothetical protein